MKRIYILLVGATALLSSCNTLNKTARTAETPANLRTATVVDIVPATDTRITHTLYPDASLHRAGENNIRHAVEHEALVKYGNADVLLEPQYIVHKQRGLFRSKITSITVSGRPAYYTNYRALNDSVWSNPAFNGLYCPPPASCDHCCKHDDLCNHPAHDALDLPYSGRRSYGGKSGGFFGSSSSSASSSSSRTRGLVKSISPYIGGEDGYFAYGALLDVGYRFSPYFTVGGGIGVGLWDFEMDDVPLYASVCINTSKKANCFFLNYRIGADISDAEPMLGVGLGYHFNKMDISFQSLIYPEYNEADVGLALGFRF